MVNSSGIRDDLLGETRGLSMAIAIGPYYQDRQRGKREILGMRAERNSAPKLRG